MTITNKEKMIINLFDSDKNIAQNIVINKKDYKKVLNKINNLQKCQKQDLISFILDELESSKDITIEYLPCEDIYIYGGSKNAR